nr:MAG: RNA-dependent RNA polymerase [Flammulina betapartitivirus 1]
MDFVTQYALDTIKSVTQWFVPNPTDAQGIQRKDRDEDFYLPNIQPFPPDRQPNSGIEAVTSIKYHETMKPDFQDVPLEFLHPNSNGDPNFGPGPLNGVKDIIVKNFPMYIHHILEWCRPTSNPDTSFADFNKPTIKHAPLDPTLVNQVISLIIIIFNFRPFQPMHFNDTRFSDLPLSTAADYFHRHSYVRQWHAKFTHLQYAMKQTTKAWFINTHMQYDRGVVHWIKHTGLPFDPKYFKDTTNSLFTWFAKRPTVMAVRSHISKISRLKVRPVYNVPMLYLRIETMLFYPMLCYLLDGTSCMMYGYETIRGGLAEMNRISAAYRSFLMIDWSAFDQTVPFIVIATFFTILIPKLIIVSHYYVPIFNYGHSKYHNDYIDKARKLHALGKYVTIPLEELAVLIFATKIHNLLTFIWTWYQEMIIITGDGFGYKRLFAGVLSGFLLTQVMDSYANLFVVLYSMYVFGFTTETIMKFRFFIMGDDNNMFSPLELNMLMQFFDFLPNYALLTFGMTVSVEKSIITAISNKIEILGYTNSSGMPTRSIDKLVAQLCYPERHVDDFINVHRAIGFAWASAGQDSTFHTLCHQVFLHYRAKCLRHYQEDPEKYHKYEIAHLRKIYFEVLLGMPNATPSRFNTDLPGPLQALLGTGTPLPSLSHFPSLSEIRTYVATWQGLLSIDHKWDRQFFELPPDHAPEGFETLEDIRLKYEGVFPLDISEIPT